MNIWAGRQQVALLASARHVWNRQFQQVAFEQGHELLVPELGAVRLIRHGPESPRHVSCWPSSTIAGEMVSQILAKQYPIMWRNGIVPAGGVTVALALNQPDARIKDDRM